MYMYPCTQWSQSQWHVGTCWHKYKFVCIIWATTVTTVPHQQTSSAIIVISMLRQSESQSQPQPQSGARRRCGGYWRGWDWDNYANGFNNFTPRPKCSAVQCRGGWGGYHVISLLSAEGRRQRWRGHQDTATSPRRMVTVTLPSHSVTWQEMSERI